MNKFLSNLKKYYPFLLNAVLPLLIFLIPVYSTSFVDEIDTINLVYNFYKLFDFSIDSIFASLNILIVFSCLINLMFFIIYMCDSYKLILYKNTLNRILLTFSFVILLASLIIFIYTIYTSTLSSSGVFAYINKLHVGSIILLVYSFIQTIIITLKFKKKQI